MKKLVKVTGNALWSGLVIVVVLSLMLGTQDARAHNKPSVIQAEVTDEGDGENKIESWMGSDEYWGAGIANGEVIGQEPKPELPVEQWMNSHAYWVNGINSGDRKTDFRKHVPGCDTHRKQKENN